MSCDVGEVTERLEKQQSSFSKFPVTSPTSQLILQPFRHFIYVTPHSQTLISLLVRQRLFSYVIWRAASRGLKFLQVIYENFDCDLTHEIFIHDFNKYDLCFHDDKNITGLSIY